MPPVVYGLVVDAHGWTPAVQILQQLKDVQSQIPAAIFNSTHLPEPALLAIKAYGALRYSLDPPMPLPTPFVKPLGMSHGKKPAWTKLALWNQPFEKIIYLDFDVLILQNLDHMAGFPGDTFTPEVCSWPPCQPDKVPAGINVGVMVIGPSAQRFGELCAYAEQRAAILHDVEVEDATKPDGEKKAVELGRKIVGSAEQSFIREFWEDVVNASIVEPDPVRKGWDWDVRSFVSRVPCDRRIKHYKAKHHTPLGAPACTPSQVHVMSRRYNARPADCARCPSDGTYKPFIVHYACSPKPWEKTREKWASQDYCFKRVEKKVESNASSSGYTRERDPSPLCQPCVAEWTRRWFDAEDRMCETLSRDAPTALGRVVGCKPWKDKLQAAAGAASTTASVTSRSPASGAGAGLLSVANPQQQRRREGRGEHRRQYL